MLFMHARQQTPWKLLKRAENLELDWPTNLAHAFPSCPCPRQKSSAAAAALHPHDKLVLDGSIVNIGFILPSIHAAC